MQIESPVVVQYYAFLEKNCFLKPFKRDAGKKKYQPESHSDWHPALPRVR